ncbi:MAG: DNA repair and recombination protein RadA [Nanobdellota archaeon]
MEEENTNDNVEEVVEEQQNQPDDNMKEVTINEIPGVGPSTAEKLKESGFDNIVSIAVATIGEVVDAVGVSESSARKMINFCRNKANMGFESGEEVYGRRQKITKIKSGAEDLDELLGGGFETGAIIECFGEYGSAKTQIAHVLCVQIQKQFPGSYAVYIDTEKTFRPERIIQLAKGADLDPEDVLKHIKVAKAYNSDHQMLLGEKVEELITKDNFNINLVVVDSLTSQFRSEYVGRGTLSGRQQKINKHMSTLSKIADVHNICVYVTNQVMSKPDQFFGDPTAAIGGHIVAHNSTFRLYLRKGKKGTRVAKLVDSPNLPDGEAIFVVESGGIKNP